MTIVDEPTSAASKGPTRASAAGTRSEPTRLLCAAAELKPGFSRQVIEALDDIGCIAVAPSPGIDLVPVLNHALIARRRETQRDAVLLLILVLAVGLAATGAWQAALILGYLAGAAATFVFAWRGYRIVVERLERGVFDVEKESVPPGNGSSAPSAADALRDAQSGNVTVYSGFSPFVGSGFPVAGWSFALDLRTKPDTGTDAGVATFLLSELYDAVDRELGDLPGVAVERRLLVDGRDVRGDDRFLPDPVSRPNARLPDQVVEDVCEDPETPVRHFMCVRVVQWDGDLVLSAFVRFTRIARTLYAEVTYTLLTPVKEALRSVDALTAEKRGTAITGLVVTSLGTTLVRLPLSPMFVIRRLVETDLRGDRRHKMRQEIKDAPSYDYGARTSIREAAGEGYRRYFQVLDKEMYLKVVERRLLDAIVRFLDDHGVDTSELKQRQEAILNQGVIISGGDVKFENTNVGQKAQLTVNRVVGASKGGTA